MRERERERERENMVAQINGHRQSNSKTDRWTDGDRYM